jgi:hypothetical protein
MEVNMLSAIKSTRRLTTVAIALLILFSIHTRADHAWGSYTWDDTDGTLDLVLVDNLTQSYWSSALAVATSDWNSWNWDNDGSSENVLNSVLDLSITNGINVACDPVSGNVQVCNDSYGNNGWLGIAQIWATRGRNKHIIAGVAKMNDTYFSQPPYNTSPWRQLVVCQEVAHTFGMGHQDENFSNVNLGSCMDYTSDPDGTIMGEANNEHPNYHDYELLTGLYGTSESTGSSGGEEPTTCNPRSPKCNSGVVLDSPADWGRLVSGHGPKEVYERVISNGLIVVTHVTWTIEHHEEHEHH